MGGARRGRRSLHNTASSQASLLNKCSYRSLRKDDLLLTGRKEKLEDPLQPLSHAEYGRKNFEEMSVIPAMTVADHRMARRRPRYCEETLHSSFDSYT